MNLHSFVLEQFFRKFDLPKSSLRQLRIAASMADVESEGFPVELFQVSIPVVARGLLNFALLQTHREWIYPYWIEQQLDPKKVSFVARSQNPLLINITHRNWTSLGTLHGFHEAIVDPRGLATPLPREWSVDVWFATNGEVLFPSRANGVRQSLNTSFPSIATQHKFNGFEIRIESFVGETRRNVDILFNRATVTNVSPKIGKGFLCIIVRPFNPEGVSPIESVCFTQPRVVSVNGAVGMVLSEKPDGIVRGNALDGDAAQMIGKLGRNESAMSDLPSPGETGEVRCDVGMATLGGVYALELQPAGQRTFCWSSALETEKNLQRSALKHTWRVSYDQRYRKEEEVWSKETEEGMCLSPISAPLQSLFEASRNTLLMLHDGDFISPGPYLYHHFWFRDAAPMLRALDLLGYHSRVRQVLDASHKHLSSDGYYRAPGGEWDSNGSVLWSIDNHYRLTRSFFWLKLLFPNLVEAARWIKNARARSRETRSTHRGLMPPSLSAEHLGTVDQYYWDSLWSLAGIRSFIAIARELESDEYIVEFERLYRSFEDDVVHSMNAVMDRRGCTFVSSTPSRPFDETAIGTIAGIYPLMITWKDGPLLTATLHELTMRYIDDRGFFHPFIHSGYNPYLTMQIAHCHLWMGESALAWKIATTIFRQATDPFSLPEAIHPQTGGGSMGDGHHGWASAEIVLFLRDCYVSEEADVLKLFFGVPPESGPDPVVRSIKNAPTVFGTVSCDIRSEGGAKYSLHISSKYHPTHRPSVIEVAVPSPIRKVIPTIPGHCLGLEPRGSSTVLKLSPDVTTLFFECQDVAMEAN